MLVFIAENQKLLKFYILTINTKTFHKSIDIYATL